MSNAAAVATNGLAAEEVEAHRVADFEAQLLGRDEARGGLADRERAGGPALEHRELLEGRSERVPGRGDREHVAGADESAVRRVAREQEHGAGVGGLLHLGQPADLGQVNAADQAERARPGTSTSIGSPAATKSG